MARLDSYEGYSEDMVKYLSIYGWHFSKKMSEWAASKMYKTINGMKRPIDPYTKESFTALLKKYGTTIEDVNGYDDVYLANMCKADYLGKAVRGEAELIMFVKDSLEDPDGYDGQAFTRFYADCIGKGTPIIWEDML